MDAWIVILAIALLRGLGAWMRRRNEQQRRRQEAEQGPQRPQPGDPDAFDLEGMDPLEESDFSWESDSELPEPEPERKKPRPAPTRRLPDIPAPRGPEREAPEIVVLSEAERKRQEYLQRLAQAASDAAREERPGPAAATPRQRHPVAATGARIAHGAERASALRRRLLSPRSLRDALLVREVLGPPVALRGPLRGRNDLQPR